MLETIENPRDIEYEVSEIGEPLLEQLVIEFDIDEETAADKFYLSNTFAKLSDESTELYKKTWQEVYEMFKTELKDGKNG